MAGEWKVTSQYIGDKKMFAVYRLRNVDDVDHSGNREYAGGWSENREAMQVVADNLNREEDK